MILRMRHTARWFTAGILALALAPAMTAGARDWFCPSTPELPSEDWEKWFVGSIGGIGARMHLIGGGNIAKGEFYRQDDWKPVILGGRLQADGTLLLHDEQELNCGTNDECAGTGLLRARLTKTAVTGTWKASPDDPPKPMQMQEEPRPKCEVTGPKRAFRNRSWPITFEYPATWHMDITANAVTLACPDPDLMANDGMNVSLAMGDIAPNGKLPAQPSILTLFTRDRNGRWRFEGLLGGWAAACNRCSAQWNDDHTGRRCFKSGLLSRRRLQRRY